MVRAIAMRRREYYTIGINGVKTFEGSLDCKAMTMNHGALDIVSLVNGRFLYVASRQLRQERFLWLLTASL